MTIQVVLADDDPMIRVGLRTIIDHEPDLRVVGEAADGDQVIEDGTIVDIESGTVWDPVIGRGLSGPLEGEQLDVLPGFTSFPKDFPTFRPDGRFWQG